MPKLVHLLLLMPLLAVLETAQAAAAEKGELKFEAVLIWGTEGEKPEGKNLKDVDPEFTEKLRKIFKWPNYYEVKRASFTLQPDKPPQRVKLSNKCSIIAGYTQKEGMEVELIGEGRSVTKTTRSMPLSDILVLAGDDKNATAWFVVIKPKN